MSGLLGIVLVLWVPVPAILIIDPDQNSALPGC